MLLANVTSIKTNKKKLYKFSPQWINWPHPKSSWAWVPSAPMWFALHKSLLNCMFSDNLNAIFMAITSYRSGNCVFLQYCFRISLNKPALILCMSCSLTNPWLKSQILAVGKVGSVIPSVTLPHGNCNQPASPTSQVQGFHTSSYTLCPAF